MDLTLAIEEAFDIEIPDEDTDKAKPFEMLSTPPRGAFEHGDLRDPATRTSQRSVVFQLCQRARRGRPSHGPHC